MKHARAQAGNALFIILLGIVLFAAFSMAVTRSNQGGGSGNPDQAKLDASRIIQYGNTLKSAVDLLRNQGVSESQISFANSTVSGYGTVGAAPTKEVFNFAGGSIVYEAPLPRWLDGVSTAQTNYGMWYFSGSMMIRDVGTPIGSGCSSSDCTDLIALLLYLKRDVCLAINKQLGLGNVIPQDSGTFATNTKFTGSFVYGNQIDDSGTLLDARANACVEGGGTPPVGTYHYYQVLIAR